VPTYRDEAVVLRTHKLGEADRIITMLSRGHGKVRAVAKGVRRTSSKFGARLEPFSHVDLQFAEGRTLDVVTQVESLHAFGEPLTSDYPGYTAGQAMLETADRLVPEVGEPAVQQYQLLVGALKALGSGTGDPTLCAPWTYAGLPALSLPTGLDGEGLPLAAQLVGGAGRIRRLLDAAAWCERVVRVDGRAPLVGQ